MDKSHAVSPKNLFLIDSLGALLTALLLFFVLKRFDEFFGMPVNILNFLSAIALIFFIYSFACHIFLRSNWKKYMRIIITANSLYALLTLSLVIYYLKILTLLGVGYFIIEIIIVSGLVFVEIRTVKTKSNNLC